MALTRKPGIKPSFQLLDAGRQLQDVPVIFPNDNEAQAKLNKWWEENRQGLQRHLKEIEDAINAIKPTESSSTTDVTMAETVIALGDGILNKAEFGQPMFPGTSGKAAREDHQHPLPDDPLPAHLAQDDPHSQYLKKVDLPASSSPLAMIVALGGAL